MGNVCDVPGHFKFISKRKTFEILENKITPIAKLYRNKNDTSQLYLL